MKKMIAFVSMLLISHYFIGAVFAASVGPTSDVTTPEGGLLQIPKIGKNPLKAGFVYDYETRKLRDLWPTKKDPEIRIHWFLAKVSFNLMDRVEPYIELGSANVLVREPVWHWDWPEPPRVYRDSFDYGASFAWGIGAKILLFKTKVFCRQAKELQIFSDAKFRRTRSQLDKWMGQGITDGAMNIKLTEWQTALGVSQEFKLGKNFTVTPYLGGKYSDIDTISKGTAIAASGWGVEGKVRYQSRYKFGPFVGMDVGIGKWMSLSVEGRFVDENSVSAAITFRI